MPPKKLKTRHSSGNCFGSSAELPDDGDLFTMRDVLAACEREVEIFPGSTSSDIADKLAPKIVDKWKQNNPELVLIAVKSINNKIIRLISTAQDIRLKNLNKKQKDNFYQKLDKLFDLLVCQCPIEDCPGDSCRKKTCPGVHVDCSCERKDRIPAIELEFVRDQREKVGHKGKMYMGKPDKEEAKRQAANNLKKASLESYYEHEKEDLKENKQRKRRGHAAEDQGDGGDLHVEVEVDDAADGDYPNSGQKDSRDHNQNRINIMTFIAEVERYFISDRAASALYNAALRTVGLITAEDTQKVVDKAKIVRGRASYRAAEKYKKMGKIKDLGGIGCVGVDGKRDRKSKKIVIEVINCNEVEKKKVGVEEHITLTLEPSGDYLTHSTIPPGKGTGRDLANN